jgi:hypothetical protein
MITLVAAAFAMDPTHAALQKVLDGHVSGGKVDYAGLKATPQALDAYLAEVAGASTVGMGADEKKAFFLDAYNALTIDLVADNWPLASIRDLDGGKVWDTRKFRVAGQDRTLNDIENKELRPLGDPRVHAALNCASKGCPPLADKVYTGLGLDAQLEAAARRFATTATLAGTTLSVSHIFEWYGDDFVPRFGAKLFDVPGLDGKAEAAVNFVATYAPDKAAALRKGVTVAYTPYDWGVNAR